MDSKELQTRGLELTGVCVVPKRNKTTHLKYEGKVFTMNSGLTCKVIKYVDLGNVLVEFESGQSYSVDMSNLRRGSVRDRYGEKVCGVGINDVVGSSTTHKDIRMLWKGILGRCYGKDVTEAYKDCSICDRWIKLSNFITDIENMPNFDKLFKQGWSLDKDILVKGNKVYSPETCCIVPNGVNQLFISQKQSRGDLPIGVIFNVRDRSFTGQLSKRLTGGNQRLSKNFKTAKEAFLFYKEAKESYIKTVANMYKDQLDFRCYEAMMNWVVEEDD